MKASDADILMIPGPGNDDPDHWLARWQTRLSSARLVSESDWNRQGPADPAGVALSAIEASRKPVVLVAHSLGVAAAIHAAPHLGGKVAGAFLVAPPDIANPEIRPQLLKTFGPYSREPLTFPSLVVASRNDPFGTYEHADDVAAAWGSLLLDAGEAGHINTESGHGPWPEGTMVFAQFLSKLKPPA